MVELEVISYIDESLNETVSRNDTVVLFTEALRDFKPQNVRFKDDEWVRGWVEGDEYTTELSLLFDTGKSNESSLSKSMKAKRVVEYSTPIIDNVKKSTSVSVTLPFSIDAVEKVSDRGRIKLIHKRIPAGYTIDVKDIDTSQVFSRDKRSAKKFYINRFILGGPIPLVNTTINNLMNALEYNFRSTRYYMAVDPTSMHDVRYSTGQQVKLRDDVASITESFACMPSGNDIINVQSSFYLSGLHELYDTWYLHGLKSKEVTDEIEIIKSNRARSLEYSKSLEIVEQNRLNFSRLLFICKKKYPNLFNPNTKEYLFKRPEDFSIDRLPMDIRHNVELTMKMIIESEKARMLSTCEHSKPLREFVASNYDGDKIKKWKALKGFILDDNSEFAKCKLCGLNVVCKHVEDLWDALSSRGVDRDDKSGRSTDSSVVYSRIVNKYAFDNTSDKRSSKGRYSCRICGEDFGSAYEFGVNRSDIKYNAVEFSDMNKIVYDVVSRKAEVRHDIKITKSSISQMIETVIEPHIGHVMQMAAAFSNSGDITSIVDMYTVLYTFAAIVAVWDIDGSVYFRPSGSTHVVQKENLRSKFITAFAVMVRHYGDRIVVDHEKAKEMLLKAYGSVREEISEWLTDTKKRISKEAFAASSIADDYLKNNAVGKRPADKPALPLLSWAPTLMKMTKSKKGGKTKQTTERKHIVYVPGADDIGTAYAKMVDTAFNNWFFYIDNKLYDVPVLTKEEHKSPTWDDYTGRVQDLQKIERRVIQATTLANTYAYSQSRKSNARYYYKKRRNLNPYICVQTNSKHLFTIYVFKKKKDGSVIDIPKKKITTSMIDEYTFVDHKCSQCGKTQGELSKEALDEDAINTNWHRQLEADGFYTMFENKCPAGEKDKTKQFHSFNKDTSTGEYTCTNCGMTWKVWLKRDQDWYQKYISVYKDKSTEIANNVESTIQPKKYTPRMKRSFKQYSEDEVKTLVQDFSDTFSVSQHKVFNLGKTEQMEEESLDVEWNKNTLKIRTMKLTEHIRLANILVSKARLSDKSNLTDSKSKQDVELAQVLTSVDKSKIPKSGIPIPDVEQDEMSIFGSLLSYLIELHNAVEPLAIFVAKQLFDIDVLYTAYNYAELKKVFTRDDVIWDENIDDVNMNEEDDMFEDWGLASTGMDDDAEED